MFSFQSNWKLSASILPWDERQIKLPLALVLLQTKKRQACEESDGYLFSDFESREVSHPFVSKKNTVGFLFSSWMSTNNLLMLQSLWTRTVSSGFLNSAEIYGLLSVRKEKFQKQSCPPGIKNIVKAFELNLNWKPLFCPGMWSTLIIKFLTASVIHASVYQQRKLSKI